VLSGIIVSLSLLPCRRIAAVGHRWQGRNLLRAGDNDRSFVRQKRRSSVPANLDGNECLRAVLEIERPEARSRPC
jgi:hypothetical protein